MTHTNNKRVSFVMSGAVLLMLVLASIANASGNGVDLSYKAVPSKNLSATSGDLAIQPDGKILIFGGFQIVNGVPTRRIVRLNPDGTTDNSFNFGLTNFTTITRVVVQSDGKILVGGYGDHPKVVRLNSDGSLDGSFTSPFSGAALTSGVTVFAVQADGKIFAAIHTSGIHIAYTALHRLNPDGSIDNSFTTLGFDGWNNGDYLLDLIPISGDRILVAGKHMNTSLFRVNPNGSKDGTFENPILTSGSQLALATSVAQQSDGKIVFTGEFGAVNGITRSGISRLNADGTLDLGFPQTGYTGMVRVLSNDKIIVGGFHRLNVDGTLDNTFNPPASLISGLKWAIDGSERIVLFGGFVGGGDPYKFARLNTDGSLDASFDPLARLSGTVNLMAMQPDGRALVYGDFTRMSGALRSNFARVEPDGEIDPTFTVGTGFSSDPRAFAVQGNGKILAVGEFYQYNGATQERIARLEANGTLDVSFAPVIDNIVFSVAVQPDDKILVGGPFTMVNGATHKLLARLNSNGTTDISFNPLFNTGSISTIVVQSDHKIIIGGSFSGVSGVARSNMARLNSDGTVDTSFNAGSINAVATIVVQPDGKYLMNSGGVLKRLNVDGSVDNTFQSPVLAGSPIIIKSLILQADGSVLIGGVFYSVNGVVRPNLARLNANGQLDLAFSPNGTDKDVNSVVMQPNGQVIIGGIFTAVDNIPRAGMARLNTVPSRRNVLFDYDGDGKADVSVYRPSNNYWYLSRSSDAQFTYHYFGAPGDIAAPADYDGDGKTDLAIFRPSSGDWWYQSSITGVFTGIHWGSNGDIPRPADIDGDGRADYVVYHPANNYWYRLSSGSGQTSERYFGTAGDKPVIGDFDGDGKADAAIFRPSTGVFWYMSSIDSVHRAIQWGTSTDIPVPADYDGDGKTDAAVYRPSTGYWYIYFSGSGSYSFTNFGIAEDKPVPADYDGDGKADIAVYRPSVGTWYILRSTAGFTAQQFGVSTDVPTPNTLIP